MSALAPVAKGVALALCLVLVGAFLGLGVSRSDYNLQGYVVVALAVALLGLFVLVPKAASGEAPWFARLLVLALAVKAGAALFRLYWGFEVKEGIADAAGYHGAGRVIANSIRHLDFSQVPLYLQPGTEFVKLFTGFVYAAIGPTLLGVPFLRRLGLRRVCAVLQGLPSGLSRGGPGALRPAGLPVPVVGVLAQQHRQGCHTGPDDSHGGLRCGGGIPLQQTARMGPSGAGAGGGHHGPPPRGGPAGCGPGLWPGPGPSQASQVQPGPGPDGVHRHCGGWCVVGHHQGDHLPGLRDGEYRGDPGHLRGPAGEGLPGRRRLHPPHP